MIEDDLHVRFGLLLEVEGISVVVIVRSLASESEDTVQLFPVRFV